MAQKYKIRNLLKNFPFCSEKIKSSKKSNKKFSNIKYLSELPFFYKKPNELTNKQLSEALPFPPKRPKRPKRERAFSGYAETYNVEVTDRISLDDSLFLVKRSINDFLKDLLREKSGFKHVLSAIITLKKME